MLKGLRSRSLSREKEIKIEPLHLGDENPPENYLNEKLASPFCDRENIGTDHAMEPSFMFTQGHPIGNILLRQQADITKLAEKCKLFDMITNVNDLCSSFSDGIQLERANTVHSIEKKGEQMEEKIIAKELMCHRLENAVEAPAIFSNEPTLQNNASKLHECMKVFSRSHKFSGSPGTLSVIEFLTDLNLAQEQCNLSEKEFLSRMLAASTGKAHELIRMWIQNQKSASSIYASLLIHFDKRPNVEEAKKMLFNYRVSKNEDLATAEGKIMCWVGLAAKSVPVGPSRESYSDLECCQALVRALPEWSKMSVDNLYKSLSAKLGRALTFNELDQALHALRPAIDRDIKQHGVDRAKNQKFFPNKKQQRNHSTFNLEVRPNTDTVGIRKFTPTRGRTEKSFTPMPINKSKNLQRTLNNRGNIKRGQGVQNYRPRGMRPNRSNETQNKMQNCILCGYKNHKAEQCKNMRDDQGKIKQVLPQFGKCPICPTTVQPRLNHPPALCPFRPAGPLYKKKN
jgi:hypothetical protein